MFIQCRENNNVANLYPGIVKRLSLRLTLTDLACQVSESSWGGALGPFVMNGILLVSFHLAVQLVLHYKQ